MTQTSRKANYSISPLILHRWSPRSLTGEEIIDEELFTLFEAARWAPSSYNGQPWRFIYAKKNTPHWENLYNLMIEFNQKWTEKAGVLILVFSHKVFDHNQKPCRTHSFDTGAAWENLALQASHMGLVAHGMQGFDYEKAQKILEIPSDYQVEAMIAIGKQAPKEHLPTEIQEKESPSDRNLIEKFIFEGKFSR